MSTCPRNQILQGAPRPLEMEGALEMEACLNDNLDLKTFFFCSY